MVEGPAALDCWVLLVLSAGAEPERQEASLLPPTVYACVRKMYRLSLRMAVKEVPEGKSIGMLIEVSWVFQVGAGAVPDDCRQGVRSSIGA